MISYVDPFIDPGWEEIEEDEDEGPPWTLERRIGDDDDDE